jgi:hypothetical protein
METSAQHLNELFSQKIASSESREKFAEAAGDFIRDRLREVSFARQILPPQQVTRADCQVSVNHDTLVKIIEVEPRSRGMSMSFRGQPTTRYLRAGRAETAFHTVSTERYQKYEQELLAYTMPITKVVEDNSVKDLQEVEDRLFLINIELAVQSLQTEANGGVATELAYSTLNGGTCVEFSVCKGELARTAGSDSKTVWPLQRPDIVRLKKSIDGNRLRGERLLMTEVDWDDILQWTVSDFGDKLQSETTVDGYKYNTLLGIPYIRTIKTDVLKPGNLYIFTDPKFFGRFYVLNQVKFYIDKVANLLTFQAWEDIAMAIVNVAAVRKLELYSGNANPGAGSQTLIANFLPNDEDALGALNNRVDSGINFPAIASF